MKFYIVDGDPGCNRITFELIVQSTIGKVKCIILPDTYFLDLVIYPNQLKDRDIIFINCNSETRVEQMYYFLKEQDIVAKKIYFTSEDEVALDVYDKVISCDYPAEISNNAIDFMAEEGIYEFKDPVTIDLFGGIHTIKIG